MSFGNFNQDSNDTPMADINTTPLVDVMLVLLIVFMVTMPVLTHSIPLDLPKAAAQTKSVSPTEPLRIAIDAQGQLFIGEKKESTESMKQKFQAALKENPDLILAISADKDVAYQHIADLLSSAQSTGIHKVGFVTENNS